jgi:DNA-binding transcriptional LysR family regulator
MEFRRGHLYYFITVAEEGQITRAARRLHLAQPALSQAIAQLEADLGIELFARHARGVTLTAAGEAFLAKARAVLATWTDAVDTARSLAPANRATIEFGFLGAGPGLDSPGLLEAFCSRHPHIDLRYRELPFPTASSAAWLAEVDVAVCHRPPEHGDVWMDVLRGEPRMLLAPRRHPLADRSELSVAEVLGETFIGLDPSVDPDWSGFWSLDDHRGAPPRSITRDRAANASEVLAALAMRTGVTTVPASVARLIPSALAGVVSIALRDADPVTIVLAGRNDRCTPHVAVLREFAASVPTNA